MSSNFLSQAIIGSLPKGMTNEDRMKLLMSLPMSPSREMLNKMSAVSEANPVTLRLLSCRTAVASAIFTYLIV